MKALINFKNRLSIVLLLIPLGLVFSCKDYLNVDRYFDDEFNIDSVYTSSRYLESYMWGAATMFPDEAATSRANHTPGVLATDEGFMTFRVSNNWYPGLDFSAGYINPDFYGVSSPNLNQWGNYYKIIRKCNNILNHLDDPHDQTISMRNYIEGNTRFIRAYAYYNLLVDFGPPILLGDEVVNTNEDLSYYDRPRSTYDEAMEYVCAEFEKAGGLLPAQVSMLDFGRPTKGAAYALVARLRLMHASPLFNGGAVARSYFSNWKRKTDGVFYVSQTYDESRWAVAAATAKRVMDLQGPGGPLYKLYTVVADAETKELPTGVTSDPNYYETFPAGAGGIDAFRSYSEMFNGEAVATIVPEFIWARNTDFINDYLNKGAFPVSMGGWSRFSVTQKVVDTYLMDDGRTKEEAMSDSYYSETGFTTSPKNFSGYQLNSGIYNMYANREMRFYASVGFCEAVWQAGSSAENNNHAANYYYGGPDGRTAATDPLNYPVTGYVIKKFVHPMDAYQGSGNRRVNKAYPIIRYAEILLSYAEALNNLNGSYTVEVGGVSQTFSRDVNAIKEAFNQVRYRAGLPGLTPGQLSSANVVQEQIERERMVEFLWENRRYYDVRRWGIYEQTEREPIMGMNLDGGKGTFYQRVIPSTSQIRGRLVDKKLIFVPIPRAELNRLPSLDQNPGW
ncbi:RagB/SusD family nutrient uptake outer membrane protein [Sphingobacterium sp. SGG-5]|uniref:RagB/SusD family nutrient uptake outer membrane protein n=1 Tax=Sphingobacterium sp. SGG-5 TaxID=2710881 RepID=UPI0013EA003B|nr:RagB/SusD family nutrient uptake outer membrane protein [Sphingobacterium sp. SGG-5]NGM60703.1 RagB/SusD family nutrient uptake outer membrane protein [Sphingobacterium sp. SGG-5]